MTLTPDDLAAMKQAETPDLTALVELADDLEAVARSVRTTIAAMRSGASAPYYADRLREHAYIVGGLDVAAGKLVVAQQYPAKLGGLKGRQR